MNILRYPPKETWPNILKRPANDISDLENIVLPVLNDIKNRGDQAVLDYTKKFDKVELTGHLVSENEIAEADQLVSDELKKAIMLASENIKKFHAQQELKTEVVETMPGVKCWRKPSAIEKVGLYVPGGTAPLFSTVLMLGIPAQIAGCSEIVLCSPPNKKGKLHPAILWAAGHIGIKTIVKAGGIQAIGAMAYGSESVPQVYKIFGPGNQYVTAAKQLVYKQGTAIDMPAGPSEVLVMGDHTANAAFIASDMLSQAEHGHDSQAIFVTTDKTLIQKVEKELAKQLVQLSREEFAAKSLSNSVCILVKDKEEAIELINEYAPEHLILSVEDLEGYSAGIRNAGSVFLGNYTPESAGDYASGTNHTLPTYGFAKMYSGVSLDDYVKKITFQQITKEGLEKIGPAIETMAEAEELTAHKNAVSLRLKG